MHNTQVEVDGEAWNCNHNGSFDGDVWIDVPVHRIPQLRGLMPANEYGLTARVEIPFELMKELVGKWIIDERISRLEQMYPSDVLDNIIKEVSYVSRA